MTVVCRGSLLRFFPDLLVPRVLIFSTFALILGGRHIQAQEVLRRTDPMGEIEFVRVVAFGDRDGPGFLGLPADVMHRHNGEWAVTDQTNQTEIKFFSDGGAWIRTLGGRGAGPGEFMMALLLHVEPDDGLAVFDPGLGRITRFSSSLEVLGTSPVRTHGFSAAFLPDNRFLVAAQLNGPDQVGLPLHLLDSVGRILRSFGSDPPIRDWGNPHKVWRMVAPSGQDAVWAAHLTEYVLERWTVEGERAHYFRGEVPWFEPQDHYGRSSDPSQPPTPGIYRIHEDANGFVWLAIRVADETWENALVRRNNPIGAASLVSRDDNLMYDTVIEVIDPWNREVVASGRHASAAWGFTNEGDLIFHRFLEDGTPVCEIWRAKRTGPE